MYDPRPSYKRGRPAVMVAATLFAMFVATMPVSLPAAADYQRNQRVNSISYKASHGKWDVVELPKEYRQNSVHAAALPTGKVLLIAGSGNREVNFTAYNQDDAIAVLKTVVYDPETGNVKQIETPEDLFCSGHALLQSGSLLVSGGTSGYEKLEGTVTKPAGGMTVHVSDVNAPEQTLPKGTRFISPAGKAYVTTSDATLKPAIRHKMDGRWMTMPGNTKVFVEAVAADPSYITENRQRFSIEGFKGIAKSAIYGTGEPMTLDKQDYRGTDKSYEFDPFKEQYVQTGDLKEGRWYPSLPVLTNGDVLAVSGLDQWGKLTNTTERYSPATRQWDWGPSLTLPTYPALFRTPDPDVLFFSGSNSGYALTDESRQPGFWNHKQNNFKPVDGLRQLGIMETSASVMLPPAKGSNDGSQSWRVMVAGGGGIGDSSQSTARTDIIDISAAKPVYTPGPDLPAPLRYLNLTVTPWDEIIANGGSTDYRARGSSYSNKTFSYNPTSNTMTPLADELIGRSYHAGSILLPDGRILVFGNDPLYGDKANTTAGNFEQRMEIFTPPQLYKGPRPVIAGPDNKVVKRGETLAYKHVSGATPRTARLIPPSSTTHVTNIEQKSIAAPITVRNGEVSIALPSDKNVLPNGWYMLFTVSEQGAPSVAKMVHVQN